MKKIISVLLLAVLLCSLAACANTDPTPDGMTNVSIESAKFNLYVPEAWIPLTSSGMSGARANVNDKAPNVLATVYYAEEPLTPNDYWQKYCAPEYRATLPSFTVIEEATPLTMGGKDAMGYKYSFVLGETLYQCREVFVVYDYNIYGLTYTAVSTEYDTYAAEVDSIVAAFTFK